MMDNRQACTLRSPTSCSLPPLRSRGRNYQSYVSIMCIRVRGLVYFAAETDPFATTGWILLWWMVGQGRVKNGWFIQKKTRLTYHRWDMDNLEPSKPSVFYGTLNLAGALLLASEEHRYWSLAKAQGSSFPSLEPVDSRWGPFVNLWSYFLS